MLLRPILYAHRGAAVELPENTLPAFRRALDLGADAIETDAHLTSDGHILLSHDPRGAPPGVAGARRVGARGGAPPGASDACIAQVSLARRRGADPLSRIRAQSRDGLDGGPMPRPRAGGALLDGERAASRGGAP